MDNDVKKDSMLDVFRFFLLWLVSSDGQVLLNLYYRKKQSYGYDVLPVSLSDFLNTLHIEKIRIHPEITLDNNYLCEEIDDFFRLYFQYRRKKAARLTQKEKDTLSKYHPTL